MLVLDENLPADQQQWLRRWRIHFRVVGVDVADSGTADENLILVLHRLSRPTLFSLDRNMYRGGIGRTLSFVWSGLTFEGRKLLSSSAGFCGIRHSTRRQKEWGLRCAFMSRACRLCELG